MLRCASRAFRPRTCADFSALALTLTPDQKYSARPWRATRFVLERTAVGRFGKDLATYTQPFESPRKPRSRFASLDKRKSRPVGGSFFCREGDSNSLSQAAPTPGLGRRTRCCAPIHALLRSDAQPKADRPPTSVILSCFVNAAHSLADSGMPAGSRQ